MLPVQSNEQEMKNRQQKQTKKNREQQNIVNIYNNSCIINIKVYLCISLDICMCGFRKKYINKNMYKCVYESGL